jgi:hypothetical protein
MGTKHILRLACLLSVVIVIPSPLWAAITFDTASSSGGTTSTSHSHTVAPDANIAIICVWTRDAATGVGQSTNVTIGGQAATFLVGQNNSTNALRVDLWYKLAPLTGAQTVAATGEASASRMVTGVMTFKNVAQTSTFNTPASIGSTGVGTDADLDNIPSAVGELVALCGGVRVQTINASPDATVPVSTEQYELGFDSGGTTTKGFGYTEDGASPTVNMRIDFSGAGDLWALAAASMREAVTATSGAIMRRRH